MPKEEKPILELNKVSLFKNGKAILSEIDFRVKKGEHWLIFGPNGAGKSFLLSILSAQYFPTSGSVSILDKKIGEYDVWKLRPLIGFISDLLQKNYHPEDLGLEVILSGFFSSIGLYDKVTAQMNEKTKRLAKLLGLTHLLNKPFAKMSHGEQRRILLARSVVLEPKLLVLDEPCSGLDPAAREFFLKSLERLSDKTTLIFVTHYPEEIIPQIKKVLLLKEGRVFAKGLKTEVLTAEKLSKLFDHPLKLYCRNGRYYLNYG